MYIYIYIYSKGRCDECLYQISEKITVVFKKLPAELTYGFFGLAARGAVG